MADRVQLYLSEGWKTETMAKIIIQYGDGEDLFDALAKADDELGGLRAENEQLRVLIQRIIHAIEAGIADGTPSKTIAYRATIYVARIEGWKQLAALEADKCSP